MTTKECIERELQQAGQEGLTKAELRRRVAAELGERNSGTFKRAMRQLVGDGHVEVEVRPHVQWGQVHIHRWRGPQPPPGQTTLEGAA